jgi:hypothetical protein
MRLSEYAFNRVLAALHPERQPQGPGGAAPADGARRAWNRRATRLAVNQPVWHLRLGAPDAKPQPGILLDFSKVGAGLLLDAVAAPGERLVVYLPCGADPEAEGDGAEGGAGQQEGVLAVLCTVRDCRVRADGRFRVGTEFLDPAEAEAEGPAVVLSAEGLADGAANLDPEAMARRSERREADGRAAMYLYRRGRQAPLEHVPVADYSEHGVAIFRGEPLAVGAEFVIRLPREGAAPITRLCRVVNAAPSDGRYRIGAEFIPFRGHGLLSRLRDLIA